MRCQCPLPAGHQQIAADTYITGRRGGESSFSPARGEGTRRLEADALRPKPMDIRTV